MKPRILIATTNPGKAAELAACLGRIAEWVDLGDFPGIPEVVEDGSTFAENARKKAVGYASQAGLWTIADDSGLVVDALDGAPGVQSARFSGDKENPGERSPIDHRNIEKVLALLEGVPAEKRTARFVCCLCLADGGRVLAHTEGTFEGIIATEPAGNGGFGYDPVFFVPQLNRTAAQLSPEHKNSISHRGKAIRKLKPLLEDLLK